MIRIVKKDINFDFVSKYKLFTTLSLIAVLVSLGLVAVFGLNFGIDFKGGTNIVYQFQKTPEINTVRKILKESGVSATVNSVDKQIAIQVSQSISLLTDKEMKEVKNYLYELYKDKGLKSIKDYQNRITFTFSSIQKTSEIFKAVKDYKNKFTGDKNKYRVLSIKHYGPDEKSNNKLNIHKYDVSFEPLSDYITEVLEAKTNSAVSKKELTDFNATLETKLKTIGMTNLSLDSEDHTVFVASFKDEKSSKQIENILNNDKFLFTIERLELGENSKTFDYSIKVSKMKVASLEQVGPKVGAKLKQDGSLAMFYALIAIFIYIAFRFDSKFSPGAVVALIHDVSITLGVFSLLRIEFNLPVIAALLTLIGYSLNDTIVIFDKVREVRDNNKLNKKHKLSLSEMVNNALNSTLSRTLLTSLTTLGVVVSMLVFGGAGLRPFSIALLLGIIVGTYSSLFIATPVYVYFEKKSKEKASELEETEA
jgi:preprotein translocase subunit SecF